MKLPRAVCPRGGPPWSAAGRLRQDPAGHGVPRARCAANTTSPASSWPLRRPPRTWPKTSPRSGIDLNDLVAQNKLFVDYVHIERSEIEETGEYDLEGSVHPPGLRHRRHRRQARGAGHDRDPLRRVCQRSDPARRDAPAVPLAQGQGRHRHHHRRAGRKSLTRYGLEEYVSDCVILLDHRVENKVANRHPARRQVPRLRPRHQRVPLPDRRHGHCRSMPITSLGLNHAASSEHIPTGVPRSGRDAGRKRVLPRHQRPGFRHGRDRQDQPGRQLRRRRLPARRALPVFRLRGIRQPRSSATCARSASTWSRGSSRGCSRFRAARPTLFGLEMHLLTMHKLVEEFQPTRDGHGPADQPDRDWRQRCEVKSMLMRLIDYLKMKQITTLFTSLTGGRRQLRRTPTWASRR